MVPRNNNTRRGQKEGTAWGSEEAQVEEQMFVWARDSCAPRFAFFLRLGDLISPNEIETNDQQKELPPLSVSIREFTR